jgi:hypothetical protein
MSKVNELSDWDLIRYSFGLGAIKEAFVDSASMAAPPAGGIPMGTPIPAGGPPIDPAMMGAAPPIDPAMMGMVPPMDPAMMGMAPPMDPAMMDPAAMGGMPIDPSAAAMGDQEAMRSIIREEIQKALGSGGGDAGQGLAAGTPKKGGNKFDEAISQLKQEMQQQTKVFVTAMRKAGIEIPLADLFSLDGSLTPDTPLGQPSPTPSRGVSEELSPGATGAVEDGGVGKIGSFRQFEQDIDRLQKLANAKDALKRSVLGPKMTKFNPRGVDIQYLNGLYK